MNKQTIQNYVKKISKCSQGNFTFNEDDVIEIVKEISTQAEERGEERGREEASKLIEKHKWFISPNWTAKHPRNILNTNHNNSLEEILQSLNTKQ